jgi:chromosome segregation ATPase
MTEATRQQGPDPTARTLETLHREVTSMQEWADLQLTAAKDITEEQLRSIRREITIFETHRIELKADNQRTVETAMIAAEKAVQAALAAAEKARDQQTIASQLATEKAEKAGKEQLQQQGETFSTAIGALNTGFNDVKAMLGELRAEKRGGKEQVTEHRAGNSQMIAIAALGASLFSGALVAIIIKLFGG